MKHHAKIKIIHPAEPTFRSVWVIEKLWTDWMENDVHAAQGYKLEGYCASEAAADALIAEAGVYQGECWAVAPSTPVRRKVKLKLLAPKRAP